MGKKRSCGEEKVLARFNIQDGGGTVYENLDCVD